MDLKQEFFTAKKEIQKIRADKKIAEVSVRALFSKAQRDLKREMDQLEEGVGRYLIKQKAENSRFYAQIKQCKELKHELIDQIFELEHRVSRVEDKVGPDLKPSPQELAQLNASPLVLSIPPLEYQTNLYVFGRNRPQIEIPSALPSFREVSVGASQPSIFGRESTREVSKSPMRNEQAQSSSVVTFH